MHVEKIYKKRSDSSAEVILNEPIPEAASQKNGEKAETRENVWIRDTNINPLISVC